MTALYMTHNPRVRAERPSASLPGALVASLLGAPLNANVRC